MSSDRKTTLQTFRQSLAGDKPPQGIAPPLAALWHAAKGEWDAAHALVQDDDGKTAAWVHAYLHRVEGDIGNAGYWYRRAGKAAATTPLEEEWLEISRALLGDS